MDYYGEALKLHKKFKGKLEIISKTPINGRDDLSTVYTPGVAQPCIEISKNPDDVYTYTTKGNTVAVVTDGSAVLGLGNIGAKAALPVMEGKCVLFKEFGGVDAIPVCLGTQDTDELVKIITALSPTYGGINLEDIAAPRCFEVERRVQEQVDIPIFHDDQHGTAVVTCAALLNAMRVVKKNIADVHIVMNGAGSAGTAIAYMMLSLGAKDVVLCDSRGLICRGREGLNSEKEILAQRTNPRNISGTLADAFVGADVFVGVSAPKTVTPDMIKTMGRDPIVLAMANPEPEIMPDLAKSAGARIVGTGRSDFPNQINNVLVFPGLFKGALSVRAKRITENMKVAAAYAIADCVPADKLCDNCIIPSVFEPGVGQRVADAVAKAWLDEA